MLNFAPAETREVIQHQEDWVNRTLRADYPGTRVCLHADRTTTHTQSTPDGPLIIRLECDYCPAMAESSSGLAPVLPPEYFTD